MQAFDLSAFCPQRIGNQRQDFGVSIKQITRDQFGRGCLIDPEVELCRRNPFSNSQAWSWFWREL